MADWRKCVVVCTKHAKIGGRLLLKLALSIRKLHRTNLLIVVLFSGLIYRQLLQTFSSMATRTLYRARSANSSVCLEWHGMYSDEVSAAEDDGGGDGYDDEDDQLLFRRKQLVLWSSDFHVAPVADLKHLLGPLGVRIIDKSLTGPCHRAVPCKPSFGQRPLRIINRHNAIDVDINDSLNYRFVQTYQDDPEMESVDAFLCLYQVTMCQLYERFNKSMILVTSTRYNIGRLTEKRWTKWNEDLRRMAANPRHVIAANNRYDVEYIRYFTGINARLLPNYCGYIPTKFTPTRPGFLLAPIKNGRFAQLFQSWFADSCRRIANCSADLLVPLRTRYGKYNYTDLASHWGIVYVPYQVSVMSLFEQYRMNIPLLFPSADLLATWQHQYMVMGERTWTGYFSGKRPSGSIIPGDQSQSHLPDPNDERNFDAIRYWIKWADFYNLPHITYYESVDHLAELLSKATADSQQTVSQGMSKYNVKLKQDLLDEWGNILLRIGRLSRNLPN